METSYTKDWFTLNDFTRLHRFRVVWMVHQILQNTFSHTEKKFQNTLNVTQLDEYIN